MLYPLMMWMQATAKSWLSVWKVTTTTGLKHSDGHYRIT